MSKIKVFEQAIKDFGVEAALEYFDVPEKDKNNFRQIFGLDPAPVLLPLVEKEEDEYNASDIGYVKENKYGYWYEFRSQEKIDPLKYNEIIQAIRKALTTSPPPEGNTPASEGHDAENFFDVYFGSNDNVATLTKFTMIEFAELYHKGQSTSHQNQVIVVWKDGTYKSVPTNSAWEFENDENWLTTISQSPPSLQEMWTDMDMVGFAGYYSGRIISKPSISFTDCLNEYKEMIKTALTRKPPNESQDTAKQSK